MADDSFVEPKASEEPYTRIKTLGRGAFGEAVLYRKKSADIILEKCKICESIIFNNRSQSPAKEIRAVFCLRYLPAAI